MNNLHRRYPTPIGSEDIDRHLQRIMPNIRQALEQRILQLTKGGVYQLLTSAMELIAHGIGSNKPVRLVDLSPAYQLMLHLTPGRIELISGKLWPQIIEYYEKRGILFSDIAPLSLELVRLWWNSKSTTSATITSANVAESALSISK